jgi:transposase
LSKLGEDITETLEVEPIRWKVIQTVRERFSCRACESVTQPPAPFHPIARGRAGASLLAMILCAKFSEHQPLNRQSEAYAREGIELDVSTLADWVGAGAATLAPLLELIRGHVLAAARLHGDDTTVPVLAKGKTITGRLWTYVRDDRPCGGPDPPAAIFFYSRDRGGEHPRRHLATYAGILQADAYAGFNELYDPKRQPGPITEAACWAHGRRKLSCWPRRRRRRSPSRRCAGLMQSSPSSGRSTGVRRRHGSPRAKPTSRRSSPSSRPGCAVNAPGCRAMPRWRRRWITC